MGCVYTAPLAGQIDVDVGADDADVEVDAVAPWLVGVVDVRDGREGDAGRAGEALARRFHGAAE